MVEHVTERAAGRTGRAPRRTNVRWLIAGLLGTGLIIAFVDRANLSVAMPTISEEFGISPAMQGVVLGAWTWTYAAFQLPAGWLTDKLGPRVVYASAVVWWSLCTAAVALARGTVSLFGLRLLLGIGEAPVMPSSAKVVSEWFPRKERALASGLYGAGSEAGAAIAVPLASLLLVAFNWHGVFLATGALGLLWAGVWLWIYQTPRKQRWTSSAEADYIAEDDDSADRADGVDGADRAGEPAERDTSIPWLRLFRYRTLWGLFSGYVCRNFLNYFFITWYPTYLVQSQGFSAMDLAKYGAIPGVVAIFGNFAGGWFSDFLVRRGVSMNLARKIPIVVGTLGSGTVAFAVFAPNAAVALTLLSVSFASSSFASAAIFSLPIDVAPGGGNVSSIFAIQNTGSQIGGLLSPVVIGFLVTLTGSFVAPLLAMGVLCLIGAAVYGLVIKVRPLDADDRPSTPADAVS
ncbi:MFS transporter [Actinopolyspora saharensis]|uniref:MFS transporter, ACS family, glucarate transporter n=1 Tax=Actinopolyspora saharensis TaxID=995062 RepID=A0A1H0YSH7_9ACTN|nr:MFS transporter [Actinopolyspora saharensis]SDQ17871.1 MFS transporter, ACS family, glucarate transporter [Actinopolyspora saharensis]